MNKLVFQSIYKPYKIPGLIFISVLLILFSCNSEKKESDTETEKPKVIDSSSFYAGEIKPERSPDTGDRKVNDLTRFISGLKPLEGSKIPDNWADSNWNKYCGEMNLKWNKVNKGHFAAIDSFAKTELADLNEKHSFLFYPFSGPDVLNAVHFFPKVDTCLLLALEPPGYLPEIENLKKDSLPSYYRKLNKAMHAILNFSFFRTISMAEDFKDGDLNGSVHLLSIFLQRTNHSITSVSKIAIDSTGKICSIAKASDKCNLNGIEIKCYRNNDNTPMVIYYFSVDISDNYLRQNTCMYNYLQKLPPVITYLKSASYLLHKPYFSIIRNSILSKSYAVFQDDSGVPVKYFDSKIWKRQLYGAYDKPIKLFSNHFQKDLKMYYDSVDKAQVKPLRFGIGYDFRDVQSNLMLFRRQ